MDDVPDAQGRGDDDLDQGWPITDSTIQLCLPQEIALSLSSTNPQWSLASGKRSRELFTTSSAKASRVNEQEDDISNPESGLDEYGLPLGAWDNHLLDVSEQDGHLTRNFMDVILRIRFYPDSLLWHCY